MSSDFKRANKFRIPLDLLTPSTPVVALSSRSPVYSDSTSAVSLQYAL